MASSSIPQGAKFIGSSTFLQKVYTATSTNETKQFYDQWASQYDKDLAEEEYAAPELGVQAVLKYLDRSRAAKNGKDGVLTVLDAGCGTGLDAACLQSAVKQGELLRDGLTEVQIDGLDLSEGMLDVARKTGLYRNLNTADFSQPLSELKDESYDVIICVGVLTKAHVGPGVLKEFVRVTKRGSGLFVATVLDEIWESGGYKSVVTEDLEKYGKVEVFSTQEVGIRKGQQTGYRMLVLRRKYLAEEIAHAGIGA